MKTYTAKVYGLVQGVGFRFFTFREADKLNIKGSVENLDDGSVLVTMQGETMNVEKLIQWLSHGPPSAQVKKIETSIINTTKVYNSFSCY